MSVSAMTDVPGAVMGYDGSLEAGSNGASLTPQDRSGNSRHFDDAVGGSRPTKLTNAQNGLSVIHFDGTTYAEANGVLDPDGFTGALIISVVKYAAASGGGHEGSPVWLGSDAGWGGVFWAPRRDGLAHRLGTGQASNDNFNALGADPGAVFRATALLKIGTSEWQYEGGTTVGATLATYAGTKFSTLANSDDSWRMGGQDPFITDWFTGDLAEWWLYLFSSADPITLTQLDDLGSFLTTKWGLTAWSRSTVDPGAGGGQPFALRDRNRPFAGGRSALRRG